MSTTLGREAQVESLTSNDPRDRLRRASDEFGPGSIFEEMRQSRMSRSELTRRDGRISSSPQRASHRLRPVLTVAKSKPLRNTTPIVTLIKMGKDVYPLSLDPETAGRLMGISVAAHRNSRFSLTEIRAEAVLRIDRLAPPPRRPSRVGRRGP